MKKYMLLLILLILASITFVKAQQNEITEPELDEILEELDFSKTKTTLVKRAKPKPKSQINPKINPPKFNFGGFGVWKLLAYLFAGILTIVVVYLIFSNLRMDNTLRKKEEAKVEDEEEHIENIDVVSKFQEALEMRNFRLALRYKFLEVLRQLSVENKIHWKAEKTNRDYSTELKGTKEHIAFKKLSNIFSWVWYGNTPIDESQFNALLPEFNSFFKSAE